MKRGYYWLVTKDCGVKLTAQYDPLFGWMFCGDDKHYMRREIDESYDVLGLIEEIV